MNTESLERALGLAEKPKREKEILPDLDNLRGKIISTLQAYSIPDYTSVPKSFAVHFNRHRVGQTFVGKKERKLLPDQDKFDYYYDLSEEENQNVRHGITIKPDGIESYVIIREDGIEHIISSGVPTEAELAEFGANLDLMANKFRQDDLLNP
jgi:hypothetical protein